MRRPELHCSNGNVVWYSLHVTVGATTLVVHEKATLSRDRIARIDLVSGTTWSQLLGITSGVQCLTVAALKHLENVFTWNQRCVLIDRRTGPQERYRVFIPLAVACKLI